VEDVVCVKNTIDFPDGQELKPAIVGITLLHRTLVPKDANPFLLERICKMADWLVSKLPRDILANNPQIQERRRLDAVSVLSFAVGRGKDSPRLLRNGPVPGSNGLYAMHSRNLIRVDYPVNFVDYAAAAAIANLRVSFRFYLKSLPIGGNLCSALYGHPIKMAAVMGRDKILIEVINYVKGYEQHVNLGDIISLADLDATIRDTMRLRRLTTLLILIDLRSLMPQHGKLIPFHDWLDYALKIGHIPILNAILDIPIIGSDEMVNFIDFFRLGDGELVAKLVAKFPHALRRPHIIETATEARRYRGSILNLAIIHGTPDVVSALLSAGADVNGVRLRDQGPILQRPLHTAIDYMDIPMIQTLISWGPDISVNRRSPRQDTLLRAAHTQDQEVYDVIRDYIVSLDSPP
jgi:hypothetical protein